MQTLATFLMPSGLAYLLFAAGLLTRVVPFARRASWTLLALGAAITLLFSSGRMAAALNSPLEFEYPAVLDARARPDARYIVVLGAWAADDPDMPVTGRLNASAAYRVLMALELHRQRPELPVIVSGTEVTTRVMADSLIAAGMPRTQVVLEGRSQVTADSAVNLRPWVGDSPFFLVTSAGHLPRAMASLERQGLAPVAVPTAHKQPRIWSHGSLAPSPDSLSHSDLAFHEYLGRIWYAIRDRA
jgi:uncharacterized SAM-binding protein YcdF (DUF218 family)